MRRRDVIITNHRKLSAQVITDLFKAMLADKWLLDQREKLGTDDSLQFKVVSKTNGLMPNFREEELCIHFGAKD